VSKLQYNPMCSICRDTHGKDRAGIKDKELCVGHLRSEHYRLESRVREIEAELVNLNAALEFKNNVIDAQQHNLESERARHTDLVEEAEKFIKKIDMVHNDPNYVGVWLIAQAHRGEYKGPGYGDELTELKAALAEVKG
jgi:hypothetical protein